MASWRTGWRIRRPASKEYEAYVAEPLAPAASNANGA
jgi:hypothetical protein